MIDYLVAAPDLTAAKLQLASDGATGQDGVFRWAQDHVFPVKAWTSTVSATRTRIDGTIETYQAPNYDARYWIIITTYQPRNVILNHVRCVLAWDAQTNQVLKNSLTPANYAALQVAPRILGHAWLGKA